jgi:hypothetical protein
VPVDFLDAEGQHRTPSAGRPIKTPDALSKLLDTGTSNGRIHGFGNMLGGWYVLYLFTLAKGVNWSLAEGWRPNGIVTGDCESAGSLGPRHLIVFRLYFRYLRSN